MGGRCSSRVVNISGQLSMFDHAVQYFTATDPRCVDIVFLIKISVQCGITKKCKEVTIVERMSQKTNISFGQN